MGMSSILRATRFLAALMLPLGLVGCAGETPGGNPGQAGATAGVAGTAGAGGNAGVSGAAGDTGVGGAGGAGVAGSGLAGAAGSGVAGAAGSGEAGAAGSGVAGAAGRGGAGGAAGRGGAGGGTAGAAGRGGSSGTSGGPAGSGGQQACPGATYNAAQPPAIVTLSGSLGTHDPMVIISGARFFLFNTANGVGTKTSMNMTSWQGGSPVFGSNPSWIAQMVPGVTNLWAPDVSFFGGSYHLYYSASTFGSNRSCIGHATRAALESGSWADQGSVVCSNSGGGSSDNWNAIDPNVVIDDAGTPWLSFGSFWGGLKMVKLAETGARADTMLYSIAARPSAGGALEAPFVFKRCGYYYLFNSWDRCCQGASSTYNTRVGRSTTVTGPYVDKAGTQLMMGGGTLLVQGDARWKGPGHNAVFASGNATYNVYHAYDAQNNGQSVLRISELHWDAEGWPVSGGP